jgi:hypothetical protein
MSLIIKSKIFTSSLISSYAAVFVFIFINKLINTNTVNFFEIIRQIFLPSLIVSLYPMFFIGLLAYWLGLQIEKIILLCFKNSKYIILFLLFNAVFSVIIFYLINIIFLLCVYIFIVLFYLFSREIKPKCEQA